MRVAIASVHVPFIHGGASIMREGLVGALRARSIQVDSISRPFRFHPDAAILRSMDEWEEGDANTFDCGEIDCVICINFPSFYIKHHHKVVWLMHQHRSVYELYGTQFGADPNDARQAQLRQVIHHRDTAALASAKHAYTISQRVSDRMRRFNGIESVPLYQPPACQGRYYCSDQLPYIFVPSRLEALKRQDLLIRAMSKVRSPVAAIIAGDGGQRSRLEDLVATLGLESKIKFLGRISQDEMLAWYANAMAVYFGPFEEDYGFVTLEAMLSSKPVLTCTDSGGSLEFVIDKETGYVCEPDPDDIATQIDKLFANRDAARNLGRAGRARYDSLGISWDNVIDNLLTGLE